MPWNRSRKARCTRLAACASSLICLLVHVRSPWAQTANRQTMFDQECSDDSSCNSTATPGHILPSCTDLSRAKCDLNIKRCIYGPPIGGNPCVEGQVRLGTALGYEPNDPCGKRLAFCEYSNGRCQWNTQTQYPVVSQCITRPCATGLSKCPSGIETFANGTWGKCTPSGAGCTCAPGAEQPCECRQLGYKSGGWQFCSQDGAWKACICTQQPQKEQIVVNATDFSCPTNVALGGSSGYGGDSLLNAPPYQARPNVAEFAFVAKVGGNYKLTSYYASGEARPCTVSINKTMVSNHALARPTGGWLPTNRLQVDEGIVVTLRTGLNILRVERQSYFPHLYKFIFDPTDAPATPPRILGPYLGGQPHGPR